MKKRELLELIDDLIGVARYQSERINTLEKAVNTVLERNPDLVEPPKPRTLDQSVFDGQDEYWQWAAVDADGEACLFQNKPTCNRFVWDTSTGSALVGGGYNTLDWQNSLIERETKREVLEGNERIRRLLEKQKFVMVKVSDDSYEDAADESDVFVCRMINESGRYPISTADENFWTYGIPVDNNGNEITEVD